MYILQSIVWLEQTSLCKNNLYYIYRYYSFNREIMQIRKEKEEGDSDEKKIVVPKSIQERYELKLNEILQDHDLYRKLKEQIVFIKRKRMKKHKKRVKITH